MLFPVLTYSLLSLLNITRKGYRFLQDKDEPKISSRIKHSILLNSIFGFKILEQIINVIDQKATFNDYVKGCVDEILQLKILFDLILTSVMKVEKVNSSLSVNTYTLALCFGPFQYFFSFSFFLQVLKF